MFSRLSSGISPTNGAKKESLIQFCANSNESNNKINKKAILAHYFGFNPLFLVTRYDKIKLSKGVLHNEKKKSDNPHSDRSNTISVLLRLRSLKPNL